MVRPFLSPTSSADSYPIFLRTAKSFGSWMASAASPGGLLTSSSVRSWTVYLLARDHPGFDSCRSDIVISNTSLLYTRPALDTISSSSDLFFPHPTETTHLKTTEFGNLFLSFLTFLIPLYWTLVTSPSSPGLSPPGFFLLTFYSLYWVLSSVHPLVVFFSFF